MNIVAELTVKALHAHAGTAWPHYHEALITACRKAPPPFGTRSYGEIYRDAAMNPWWMALIQMNIAEIRTRVHHLLQRPMLLAHCAPERRRRLARVLDALLLDETRHIAYTAALIEEFACSGEAELVKRLMQERLSDFNAITNEDLGRNVFESV